METLGPWGGASLEIGPQGHGWQGLCREPPFIPNTFYIRCRSNSFREENFFSSFSNYKSMGAICCHGN